MPICPGCEQKVPYDQLDLHQRHCDKIRNDSRVRAASMERMDRRLESLESRLEARLTQMEADLERRLSKVEKARRDVEPTGRTE